MGKKKITNPTLNFLECAAKHILLQALFVLIFFLCPKISRLDCLYENSIQIGCSNVDWAQVDVDFVDDVTATQIFDRWRLMIDDEYRSGFGGAIRKGDTKSAPLHPPKNKNFPPETKFLTEKFFLKFWLWFQTRGFETVNRFLLGLVRIYPKSSRTPTPWCTWFLIKAIHKQCYTDRSTVAQMAAR